METLATPMYERVRAIARLGRLIGAAARKDKSPGGAIQETHGSQREKSGYAPLCPSRHSVRICVRGKRTAEIA